MKPCRIVKSAYARARQAGTIGANVSLKMFARNNKDNDRAELRLCIACTYWLENKRSGASKARANHLQPLNGFGPTASQIEATKRNRDQHHDGGDIPVSAVTFISSKNGARR